MQVELGFIRFRSFDSTTLLAGLALFFYFVDIMDDVDIDIDEDDSESTFSVLITGCSRGIGLEMVKKLLTHYDPPSIVIATCRNPEAAQELLDLKRRFNHFYVLKLDVDKIETYPELVETVKSIVEDNGLNVLINNAGIIIKRNDIEEVSYDDYTAMFKTNTFAPVFLSQALLPLIKKASDVNSTRALSIKRAAIINISSVLGSISLNTGGYWGYSESKAALNQASRSLACNVRKYGILVTVLHPGWVQTEMGGPRAPIPVEESVNGLLDIIYNLSEYSHDSFLRYDGEELPW